MFGDITSVLPRRKGGHKPSVPVIAAASVRSLQHRMKTYDQPVLTNEDWETDMSLLPCLRSDMFTPESKDNMDSMNFNLSVLQSNSYVATTAHHFVRKHFNYWQVKHEFDGDQMRALWTSTLVGSYTIYGVGDDTDGFNYFMVMDNPPNVLKTLPLYPLEIADTHAFALADGRLIKNQVVILFAHKG